MWMVGYNIEGGDHHHHHHHHHHHELNNNNNNNMVVDHNSMSGRKLRPLVPRPMSTCPNNNNIHHGNDLFSHYHHHSHLLGEQNSKREQQLNGPITPVVVSSRWNPTPEQLRALEELYRRGTRTPSAEQIQHITAQLTRFGKIEGKNVFYWFQNHKARERQKRRRQSESHPPPPPQAGRHHLHRDSDALEKKELAASRTVVEAEETKNWALSTTNCTSTLLAQEPASILQRTAKAGGGAECRPDGWLQLSEGELLHRHQQQQQRRNNNNIIMERNATWHNMVHLSLPPNNAINYMATTTTRTMLDPKLIKAHDLSFFISTQREKGLITTIDEDEDEDDHHNNVESQTLQLFPLRSGGDDNSIGDKETNISASSALNAANNNLTPRSQFFEFLPLKN